MSATQLHTAKAHDDAVRERHGVQCVNAHNSRTSLTIWEEDDQVLIDRDSSDRKLTEWQARYLAAKLYRLARRIRQRRAADEQS